MKPNELFCMIRGIHHNEYNTSGDDVQWIIRFDSIEKKIRLIFEETAGEFHRNNRDWMNNLNFPAKVYKNQKSCIKVARGWGDAYKSCNDEIINALISAINEHPDYDVEICGWSYGGAMCLIASEDLHYRTGIKPTVITFGAPKPLFGLATKRYVRSCVKEVHQYTHVNDCVPMLPPFIGYHRLTTDYVGGIRFICKLFRPEIYHCLYGEADLYV